MAAVLIRYMLIMSDDAIDLARSSPCGLATAVEAGVVPVLLGCLACSGHLDDERVQSRAAEALVELAAALGRSSPGSSRQLPEPLHSALQPAVAALAGLLRSMQQPAVAAEVLYVLANIALADKALAAQAVAASAGQLAAQWSRRLGAPAEVVHAAQGLLSNLAFQGDTVPADTHTLIRPSSMPAEGSAGHGQGSGSGGQVDCCATCNATSRSDGKALMRCSACRGVSYCSGACQKQDWGRHKGACRRVE
jgi:hypothetical protein